MPSFNPTALLSPGRLHLTLLPTERCNFRCEYCYESFAHGRMSPGVVQGVKLLLERRCADLAHLELSWFGGEPLLALDIVEEIQSHAWDLTQSNPRLLLRASMTTNAFLLTPEVLERLVATGITQYQITLDGPEEVHDRKRVTAGGEGTFRRIWDHLLAYRNLGADFEVLLRLHAARDNPLEIRCLLRQISREFGGDPRYRVFVSRLSRLGGPNDEKLPVLGAAETRAELKNLRSKARDLGLTAVNFRTPAAVCYAAAGNSLVIRSTGEISKCTVALGHPNNLLGRIDEKGRLAVDDAKLGGWLRGLLSGDRRELQCPMRGFADAASSPTTGLVQLGGA